MIEIDGKTHYSAKGVAFIAGVGRNNLYKLMRKKKVLDGNNIPTDKYWHMKWFRCVTTKKLVGEITTTYWTVKGVIGTIDIIKEAIANKEINIAKRKKEYDPPPFHLVKDVDREFLDLCIEHEIEIGRIFSKDRKRMRTSKHNTTEKNEAIEYIKANMCNTYDTKIKEKHYEKENYTERRVQEHDVFDGTDIRDKG